MIDLKNSNIVIVGQLRTSRTETLEAYLKDRVHSLCVVGIMSPFATHNEARCTLYEKGDNVLEFPLPMFTIRRVRWWDYPLITISFVVYVFAIFRALWRVGRRFDIFIGIATFSSMIGLILKRLGRVSRVIYYCLDFYPAPRRLGFDRIVNEVYKRMDTWCVRKADMVWDISPRIAEARERYWNVSPRTYEKVIVPLGYSNDVYRNCSLEKRERWTLGFVGTLSENQGLQMVVEAMPILKEKYPEIKIRVIGHGPYGSDLKKQVQELGVEENVVFHGFIQNDEEVYDILSRCMIGLATWTGDETDNSLYADPGKPKLYALLGLPIIITDKVIISGLVAETGAGEVINYSIDEYVLAVDKIIASDKNFQSYTDGVERFRTYCKAETIFDKAFSNINEH